jgi:TonB family protein
MLNCSIKGAIEGVTKVLTGGVCPGFGALFIPSQEWVEYTQTELQYMFAQLHPVVSKRQAWSLGLSLIAHFLFLGWLLHSPAPIFVAPISVTRGQSGTLLTRIYFGGERGVTQEKPNPHLDWQRPAKTASAHRTEPPAAKRQSGNESAANRPEGPAVGSAYGSLSYGKFIGSEIRPALPQYSPDPVFGSDATSLQGDVIVEVTIDEQGTIIQKIVLQSLGPAVDERVLAALEKWRFTPASKNGTPIPSKQDVYYHFPR